MKRTIDRALAVSTLALVGVLGLQSAANASTWTYIGNFGNSCDAVGERYMSTGNYLDFVCFAGGALYLRS